MRKKVIPGFPLYTIYENGEIWREEEEYFNNGTLCKRPRRKCTPTKTPGGYYQLKMKNSEGKWKKHYVHVLLAEAFIPKPLDKKKVEVNHIDGNKGNNTLDNLEWLTHKENIDHAIETGLFNPVTSVRTVELEEHICKNCGKSHFNKTFCSKTCADEYNARNIPQKEELIDMMKHFKSFFAVAPYYKVHEATVRKWCRKYKLPDKVSGWK